MVPLGPLSPSRLRRDHELRSRQNAGRRRVGASFCISKFVSEGMRARAALLLAEGNASRATAVKATTTNNVSSIRREYNDRP
jgi:hypothetical protein